MSERLTKEEFEAVAEAYGKKDRTSLQREWVGLTDEEIMETLDLVAYDTMAFDFAYRIEAKLREKNT